MSTAVPQNRLAPVSLFSYCRPVPDRPLPPLTEAERDLLRAGAREAALAAYAPYSRFRVGAAVLTDDQVVLGCNVENASYGLCLCAERSALASAIACGHRQFRALAVACIDAQPDLGPSGRMPCGACRQWLVELAPEAEVLIDGDPTIHTAKSLLPTPFRLTPP